MMRETHLVAVVREGQGKSRGKQGNKGIRPSHLQCFQLALQLLLPLVRPNSLLTISPPLCVTPSSQFPSPGVDINSTTMPGASLQNGRNSSYMLLDGTSQATPHWAGLLSRCYAARICSTTTSSGGNSTGGAEVAKLAGLVKAYNQANTGYGYQGDPLRPNTTTGRYYGYFIAVAVVSGG
jgi:hypothetical protein